VQPCRDNVASWGAGGYHAGAACGFAREGKGPLGSIVSKTWRLDIAVKNPLDSLTGTIIIGLVLTIVLYFVVKAIQPVGAS